MIGSAEIVTTDRGEIVAIDDLAERLRASVPGWLAHLDAA